MSTGKELSMIPKEISLKSQEYVGYIPKMAQQHFDANLRLLYKDFPEFAA